MKQLGILTSGGDCPGVNAVIRGAVLGGDVAYGYGFLGFRDGWRGVLEQDVVPLPRSSVRGLSRLGGTVLGTSRTNPLTDGGTLSLVFCDVFLMRDGLVRHLTSYLMMTPGAT